MFVTKVEKEIINFERETKKNVKNRNNVYFCKETLFHKNHCFIQTWLNIPTIRWSAKRTVLPLTILFILFFNYLHLLAMFIV